MTTLNKFAIGLIAATVIAVLACAAFAPPAKAAGSGFCKDYARAAVNQFNRNVVNGCGYAGWRWHAWKGGHYKWCRHTSKGAAMSERVARWRMLDQCW